MKKKLKLDSSKLKLELQKISPLSKDELKSLIGASGDPVCTDYTKDGGSGCVTGTCCTNGSGCGGSYTEPASYCQVSINCQPSVASCEGTFVCTTNGLPGC